MDTRTYGGLKTKGGWIHVYSFIPSVRRRHMTGIRIVGASILEVSGMIKLSSFKINIVAIAPAFCACTVQRKQRSVARSMSSSDTSKRTTYKAIDNISLRHIKCSEGDVSRKKSDGIYHLCLVVFLSLAFVYTCACMLSPSHRMYLSPSEHRNHQLYQYGLLTFPATCV